MSSAFSARRIVCLLPSYSSHLRIVIRVEDIARLQSPPVTAEPRFIIHPSCPGEAMLTEICVASQRRLISKIDFRVIPILSLMYLMAFLDRTNIANASVFGLQKDLKLTGTQYNTALTMFFIPYVVFEIPSNIILKRLKPHVWLSGCMFLFGLVTVCQGLVQNWSGLLATRFFLGLAETGMFPGAFYLIGMWYKRSEAQKRYSFFFGSATLAGAFSGLLASAIGKMNGMRGYDGWRWIFILGSPLSRMVLPERPH